MSKPIIIFKYLRREVLTTTVAVTGILLLVFLSNQLVRYLGRAAAGQFPGSVVLKIMLLQIPQLIGLLMPLGMFIAILLVYGRLYVDSEMTVFAACGIGREDILRMTMRIGVVVMALVAICVFILSPGIRHMQDQVISNAKGAFIADTIIPGRFVSSPDGRRIYYVEDMARDRDSFSNIFVAEKPKQAAGEKDAPWTVLMAKQGSEQQDKSTGDDYLVTEGGYQYRGTPGEHDFRITSFKQYGVSMSAQPMPMTAQPDALSTWQLIRSLKGNIRNIAELQWRLSMPLSALLLVFLAMPLSRVKPREGRFAKLVPSILIYVAYANLLFMARSWIEKGTVNPVIGMWWVHMILAVLGLVLVVKELNLWPYFKKQYMARYG